MRPIVLLGGILPALLAASALPARQEPVSADAQLRQAFDAWQAKWKAYVDAAGEARRSGQLPKGGVPPESIQAAERAASELRDGIVQRFGGGEGLSADSCLLLARVHEASRDYGRAVLAYERSLAKGDAASPSLQTLGSLCLAAMNSKDDALAARWMRKLIAEEDRRGSGRRNLQVRTSYFPRTLIGLGDWDALAQHLEALAEDDAAACKAAAATFGVVLALHRGDVTAARRGVEAIRSHPGEYPDHQAWAVLAQLALHVHAGEFDAGAIQVREFLAESAPENGSAVDKNHRRYLTAIEPFLGKTAPPLRADHCVGGDLQGSDVLPGLRGKVVVLDFWQPWCEPCRKAMPEMVRAQTDYAGAVQVLGVCKVENYGYDVSAKKAVRPIAPAHYPAHVADFRADMALNYPLLVCDTPANSEAYRIAGVPTLVVIDRAGIVRYMSCGAGEPGVFQIALTGVAGKPQR
jgi:thiol-disulfide isomerase/thioredoxin